MRRAVIYILFCGLALSAGIVLSRYWQSSGMEAAQQIEPTKSITERPLLALDGTMRTLSEWRGKVLMVNFWATWCAPCRLEIPVIKRAREQYLARSFEVIGIAIDELSAVVAYRDELDIGYPLLMAVDDPVDLLSQFGDDSGVLPYSVIMDPSGQILATHTGPLTASQLEALIVPHL